METAICLTIGFCLGAGAAVALLFCVRTAAGAAGLAPGRPGREMGRDKSAPGEPGTAEKLTFERQLQNLFAYDGKPQKKEGGEGDD